MRCRLQSRPARTSSCPTCPGERCRPDVHGDVLRHGRRPPRPGGVHAPQRASRTARVSGTSRSRATESRRWRSRLPAGRQRRRPSCGSSSPPRRQASPSRLSLGSGRERTGARQGREATRWRRVQVSSVAVLDGSRVSESFREMSSSRSPPAARSSVESRRRFARPAPSPATDDAESPPRRAPSATRNRPRGRPPALERLRMFFREQYARMLAHDPGVRLGERPRGAAPAPRRVEAAALGAQDSQASAGPVLGGRPPRRAVVARRRARPGARRRRDVPSTPGGGGNARSGRSRALKPLFDKLAAAAHRRRKRGARGVAERALLRAARVDRERAAAGAAARGQTGSLEQGHAQGVRAAARRRWTSVDASPTDEAIHQARIKGKRARYATELARGRPRASAAQKLIAAAKELPGRRGRASGRCRRRGADPRAAARAALAANGARRGHPRRPSSGSGARGRRRRFPKAWERVEKAAAKVWA